MPDVKTIHDQIHARLAEVERLIEPLRVEADQLSKLAAAFDAPSQAPGAPAATTGRATRSRAKTTRKTAARAPRPATSTTPRPKRGRPLGGGNRAQQAVEQITKNPGITASELATAMGIGPNYLYRVLPQLQRDDKITKQGKGYHPAAAVGQATQANGQGVTV
ncbi:MAG TPA: hypothetical protein VIJ51_14125 [Solirubrobacteraceae bacterium]